MARRGGTDYAKWAAFDDEDDDPLAKLTIGNERRHPSLPKVVRKHPEAPSSASKVVPRPRSASRGRKAATEPAAPRPKAGAAPALAPPLPGVVAAPADLTELAPLKEKYAVELLCDPN